MNQYLKSPIRHMAQGLAHWMAYRWDLSGALIIEADAVLTAIDILRANLPNGYILEREVTKKSLSIVGNQRIDLGIKSKISGSYVCLIEFKLADATNAGYLRDVEKLRRIKLKGNNIDCLVVILYRKSCPYSKPKEFVQNDGKAIKKVVKVGSKKISVRARCVCNSFTSFSNSNSRKTVCLELV